MDKVYPQKLNKGDQVRIVAPSRSLAIISKDSRETAKKRFDEMGFELSFGKHVEEMDEFVSSSIESRVEDLNEAFGDKNVKAILTVIGGFNSNQLLRYLDWETIKNNPKVFCGFSDITALNNAFYAKTGLVNYSGPHYSTFSQELYFDYTMDYFKKAIFSDDPYEILASKEWSDDVWYKDQKDRRLIDNAGWMPIHSGRAEGTIVGGNLGTLNLLQGTEYFPDLENTILFIEDDGESQPHHFDRDLQSLIHLSAFTGVRGVVIGRFQKVSNMDNLILKKIIESKQELNNLPIVANLDFGHTDPKITIPIGGLVKIEVGEETKISILKH